MLISLLAENWWAVAGRGALAILFGILAWSVPGATLGLLVACFGAFAIVDGFFSGAAGICRRGHDAHWGLWILRGLLGVLAGTYTFAYPQITAFALAYVIGAWAVAAGVLEIVAAIQFRKAMRGEWLLAVTGALSILFGGGVLANPGAGIVALLTLLGAYAMAYGVFLVLAGFRLKSLRKRILEEAGRADTGLRGEWRKSA